MRRKIQVHDWARWIVICPFMLPVCWIVAWPIWWMMAGPKDATGCAKFFTRSLVFGDLYEEN